MAEHKGTVVDPGAEAAIGQAIRETALETRANYGGFRTNPRDRFEFARLARIVEVNHVSNTVTVAWIDQMGTRDEVPITHPYVGHRGHILTMPTVNSLCIVGFMHSIRPFIITYLPFNYPLMVEVTQFPERIVDVNFETEQFIKTHVGLREDFDLTSVDGEAIRAVKDLEIATRIARTRLEEFAISKPLLEPGEISISSFHGAEARFDQNLRLTDMNLDEIRLQASDNSMHFLSMHMFRDTEFAKTQEGHVFRPFSLSREQRQGEKKEESDPFKKSGKVTAVDGIIDPMLDRLMLPIGPNGKLDVEEDEASPKNQKTGAQGNKEGGFESLYQEKINRQLPFVERLVTVNEVSDNSLNIANEANLIPLPEGEQWKVNRIQIERTDRADGIVNFNVKQKQEDVKFIKDINPFRPIENRYKTFRQTEQAPLQKDSLFNKLDSLLGLDPDFFGALYQDLVETPDKDILRDRKKLIMQLQDTIGEAIPGEEIQDVNEGGEGTGKPVMTRVEDKLKELRDKLRHRIAGSQLGIALDDDIINESFAGKESKALREAKGIGNNDQVPPIGPLMRIDTGTLVDGHDRILKEPWTFENISMQMRHQTGAFVNLDRRGSLDLNVLNLAINTTGMSFVSGIVWRNICETKVKDKFKEDAKIYLPEPIPTDTPSNAGKVLNIDQKDASQGSDPRDRANPSEGKKAIEFVRTGLGQIPGPHMMPPIDEPAVMEETNENTGEKEEKPISFLNEFHLKIPKTAKPKPRNDIYDPPIIGYDAPRTKELALFSPQIDLKLQEEVLYPPIKDELKDKDMMGRDAAYIEIIGGTEVDRDGTIIRSSMTQRPISWDVSLNSDSGTATHVLDDQGNLDSTYNNIYESFNAGMYEAGLVYKVTQSDEEVLVRLEAEEEGKEQDAANPNEMKKKEPCKKGMAMRKAYRRESFKNLGHVTFKVNAQASEQVRTEVKTPKEIEKENSHKKVEDRDLRAPFENVPSSPDVELSLGGVVNNNHSEAVKEALGFVNHRLHYRVKKTFKENPELAEFQPIIDSVVAGDDEAPAMLAEALEEKKQEEDFDVEEFIDLSLALLDAMDKGKAAQTGESQEPPTVGSGPTSDCNGLMIASPNESARAARAAALFAKDEALADEFRKLCNFEASVNLLAIATGENAAGLGGDPLDTATPDDVCAAAFAARPAVQEKVNEETITPPPQESVPGMALPVGESIPTPGVVADEPEEESELSTEICKFLPDGVQAFPGDPSAILGLNPQFQSHQPGEVTRFYDELCRGNQGIKFPVGYYFSLDDPGVGAARLLPGAIEGAEALTNVASEVAQGFFNNLGATFGLRGLASNSNGRDARFPEGACIDQAGGIVVGQGNFTGGESVHPRSGDIYTGSAFGDGGVEVGPNGELLPPADTLMVEQINEFGWLAYPLPLRIPLGMTLGPKGVLISMPAPGEAGNPNDNPPIDWEVESNRSVDRVASAKHRDELNETEEIPRDALTASPFSIPIRAQSTRLGTAAAGSHGASTNSPSFPPESQRNVSNADLFPSVTQSGEGPGGSNGLPSGTTVEEVDVFGNWAVRSSVDGVNMTVINSLAQLQVGRVVDKNQQGGITNAMSLKGPQSQARLALKNGAGMDLDANGNFIGYATEDLLLRANLNGEMRTYGDMFIVSDKRSVLIQAEGGPNLGAGEKGLLDDGGKKGTPTAELVVGRVEFRGGDLDGTPLLSGFGHEINIALMKHLGPDQRSMMGIDAGGNFIFESNVKNRSHNFKFKNAHMSLGGAVTPNDGTAEEKKSFRDTRLLYRIATDSEPNSEDEIKTSEIAFDEEGTIFGIGSKDIYLSTPEIVDVISDNQAIYLTAFGEERDNTTGLVLGPMIQRFGPNEGDPDVGVFGNQPFFSVRHADVSPNHQREIEIDGEGNFSVNIFGGEAENATTYFNAPAGEIQLGSVKDNVGAGNDEAESIFEEKSKYRVLMGGDARIEIDEENNIVLDKTSADRTTLIRSPEGEIQLGSVKDDVGGTNSDAESIFDETSQYRVLMGDDARIEIDEENNIVFDKTSADRTTLIRSPEGEVQLGAVKDVTAVGNPIETDPGTGRPLKYRIKMTSGAAIQIDDQGNVIIDTPGQVIVRAGGDIDVATTSGDVTVSTASGNTNVESASGNVSLIASSGNVNVSASSRVDFFTPTVDFNGATVIP